MSTPSLGVSHLLANLVAIEETVSSHFRWRMWDQLLLNHISLFWATLVLCFLPRKRPLGPNVIVSP